MVIVPIPPGLTVRVSDASMDGMTDTLASSPATHLLGWDCIEFWVGNARTTAGFLMSAFGFECTAFAGFTNVVAVQHGHAPLLRNAVQ